jgi:hypothetical protein
LLAVTQRGVENDDAVLLGLVHGGHFEISFKLVRPSSALST